MDLGDLFRLVRRPFRNGQQGAAVEEAKRQAVAPVVRLPDEGEGVALSEPAVRPRTAIPPPPVAPPQLVKMNTVGIVPPDLDPSHIDPRVAAPAPDIPPVPQKQVGLIGLDVDARDAGMGTRPRVADPLEFAAGRVRDDLLAPPATSHHSRLYEAGAGALRGFAAGGLGGAIFGAAQGGINPDSVARLRQREQTARDQNAYLNLYQQQKAQADLQSQGVADAHRVAEIYKLQHPELYKNPSAPHYETRADGTYVVDAQNPEGRKLSGVPGKPATQGRPQTIRLKNPDGSEKVVERGADGVWKDTGLVSAGQPRRRITLGGETFELPESEAARVLAQIEAANVTADAQRGAYQTEAGNANAQRQWEAKVGAWKLEGERAASYNSIKDEMDNVAAQLQAIDRIPEEQRDAKSATQYAQLEERLNRLRPRAQAAADALNREFVTFRPDERAVLGPQPVPPRVEAKPGPQRRSASVAPRVALPTVITARSSEDEVRAEARRRGKDENAAVEKWRRMRQ